MTQIPEIVSTPHGVFYGWTVTHLGQTVNVRINKDTFDRLSTEAKRNVLRLNILNAYHGIINRSINIV